MNSKNSKQVFVVRGSGYGIDNSMVTVTEEHMVGGEKFLSVIPAAPRIVGKNSILIHEKYLQPVDNRLKEYIYTFTVSKRCLAGGTIEQDLRIIDNAYRNMDIKSILDRLEIELTPLLRLE